MIAAAASTLGEARRALAARFRSAGLDTPELDARLLSGAILRLDLTSQVTNADRVLSAAEIRQLDKFAARRLGGEPVARILGTSEFWGLPLRLSTATLVPRPETETLVEAALAAARTLTSAGALRIADLGTGTGAILLALLTELKDAFGVGTDISTEAAATAACNAHALGLQPRAGFVVCDYSTALAGPFDLIVSNPPYIRTGDILGLATEVRDHDPRRALDGGDDGLDAYRRIAPETLGLLRPGGVLLVEIGQGQGAEVTAIMAAAGFTGAGLPVSDFGGIPRVVIGRKPGG